MRIKIDDLRGQLVSVLASKYYSKEEAEKIADVFLYAELTGRNTQGILKLLGSEPAQNIEPKHPPKVVKETELSALVDGGGAAGPLGAQFACDKVIEIASKKGFGVAGLNNTFSSVGAMSYYAQKIAKHDLIGFVAANSPRAIAHWGGIEPAYGTNPLASAITWYGLVRAKMLGQELPGDVALDKEGSPTRDPEAAMAGSILPFDRSYKGAGFAMVVELLAGVLPGASYVFDEGDWGTTFIAFSPDLLIGTAEFKKRSSELVAKVKKSKARPGMEIHIPGYDAEAKMYGLTGGGEVEIADKVIGELKALQK
jgi:L-2-hydroxycarboxylate dehydrogenase (NAD+)